METTVNNPKISDDGVTRRHILVGYATCYGTTQQVATFIGKILQEKGYSVDIKNIGDITQLEKYDAVIIGSPIQYDTWMPAARKLVKNNTEILNKMPVAYFFNCLTLARREEKTINQANKYAETLRSLNQEVQPVSVGQFAGVLKFSELPIHFKVLFYFLLKYVGIKEGDYRDWDEIKHWTNETIDKMELLKSSQ